MPPVTPDVSPLPTAPSRRLLPSSQEAEVSVVGGILLYPKSFHQVADLVEAGDFYHPTHAAIYQAMCDLDASGRPIDQLTVAEQMKAADTYGKLRAFRGEAYFAELMSAVVTVENLAYHARLVRDKATARRLIETAQEIVGRGHGEYGDVSEFIDEAERSIFEIAQRSQRTTFQPIRKILNATIKAIELRYERKQAVTGVPTGFHKLDAITAGFQPGDLVIVAARPSMGKCLTARTLIADPETGDRLSIEECVRRRLPWVHGASDDGELREARVAEWIDSGRKPCFRVRTRLGREVEVTGHHPFLTALGWVPLHSLAVGRRIAVPRRVPAFGTSELAPDAVRLLAYFVAGGALTQYTPRFTTADAELVADFTAAVERTFPSARVRSYGPDYAVVGEGGEAVKEWLRGFGLSEKRAEERRVPPAVWRLRREGLALFLRVLFSADGSQEETRSGPRIELSTASEALGRDVQHALTRLGILARLWRRGEGAWRLEIADAESVATFLAEVGWMGAKADHLATPPRPVGGGHAPPESWELLRQRCAAHGISTVQLGRMVGEAEPAARPSHPAVREREAMARSRLRGYAVALDDAPLARAASPDLYWDEIVEITPIGEEQVYDLCVPDGHNFVAADVLVHNTSLVMNAAQNAAIESKVPVLVFSLEMSSESLMERLLCSEARVDSTRLRTGFLESRDWINITKAAGRIAEAPISIDDTGAPSLMEIRAKCRRWRADPTIFKKEGQHGMVVVDYLQLIHGRPSGKEQNREREISEISRGLKALAKELRVPVIALSQLNRGVESRSDKRPQLSDLRESGAIEQDADLIAFIYRDEVYNKETADKNVAEIIIGKQRNGAIGTVRLAFLNQYTRFENLAEGREE